MAVDLGDLVDALKAEVSPPGSDLYPDANDDSWFLRLQNGFWDARIYGLMSGYEENAAARGGPAAFGEGIITPLNVEEGYDDPAGFDADTDLGREWQQLIVLWTAWKVTLTKFQDISTVFRARAPGPTEFEEQKSAQLLKAILDQLRDRIHIIINNLSTLAGATNVVVLDAIIERDYSMANGDVWWVR